MSEILDVNGYKDCFKLVPRLKVLDYKEFGGSGYYGTFLCKVRYEGKIEYIYGDFGSCTVCDNFEVAFTINPKTKENLISFAESYLGAGFSKKLLIDHLEGFKYPSNSEEELLAYLKGKTK